MDPVSTLQWVNAGSGLLNAVGGLNRQTPDYTASGMGPTVSGADVDFSGFTVATGQAKATGATISKTPSSTFSGAPSDAGAQQGGSFSPALLIGLAAITGMFAGNS